MSTPSIPILDLKPEIEASWGELVEKLGTALRSGQLVLGPNVAAFEKEMAAYLGVKHAVGLNSGTDALIIALRALGIGPGDEVITSPFSFFATAEAVSLVGAKPVFVDVCEDTFNLDVSQIAVAITAKTRAIIPVHLFGLSCEIESVLQVAAKSGLRVIEDVAQATGADFEGKKLGSLGDFGAFSFFPTKNLGAYGDGGLVTTNSDELATTCRKLRNHGSIVRYQNETLGYNSRLDELQATVLRLKLPRLDHMNKLRQEAAVRYTEMLATLKGISTPRVPKNRTHVFHQFTCRIAAGKRDQVAQALAAEGISTMVYYPTPIHLLPVYRGSYPSFPVCERLAGEVLSLPLWPEISAATQQRVVDALSRALTIS